MSLDFYATTDCSPRGVWTTSFGAYCAQPVFDESAASISTWADETFGPAKSNLTTVRRAIKEMAELEELLLADDDDPKACAEVADVIIVLSRILEAHKLSIQAVVNAKMKINRARKWVLNGDGTGQHVHEGE